MSSASLRSDPEPPDDTVALLVARIRRLEAELAARPDGDGTELSSVPTRKPKGGPMDPDTRRDLVVKRERLELARLAEQAAWEDVKAAVAAAAADGASYREIAEAIGVTRARVYQLVSGKR
ncbi:MAG TPA: helix-turn-helix domain-containing protein [Acidimicrobiales bacterium]|nr:helix-turn-helix domain-containing protein [Acidimicrobiales bacterium]